MKVIVGLIVLVIAVSLVGCDLMTERDKPIAKQAIGNELIINEVFNISPDKYYSYSWIEVFNPTPKDIGWFSNDFPASGWVGGAGGFITKTTETGSVWETQNNTVVPKFYSIDYFSEDTVFACSDSGKIYRSGDGGLTWELSFYDPAVTTKNLYGISVLKVYESPSNKVIYACGDSGTVLRSVDRGRTFQRRPTNRKERLNSINMFNQNTVIVAGDSVLLKLRGTTWDTIVTPIREKFNSVKYAGLNLGRFVGNNGTIFFTADGTLLTQEISPVTSNLNSVSFLPEGKAWAVGDNGVIIKAEAAAVSTWRVLHSGTSKKLNYVQFVDTLRGFVLGNDGLILYTKDGGETWEQQASGTSQNLLSAAFLPFLQNVLNIYVVEVTAQRRHIYWERPFPPNPDFITRTDTGKLYFVDQGNRSINAGGFVVITSDENKFTNHTYTGPSEKALLHNTVAAVFRASSFDSIFFAAEAGQFTLARWNLLAGSEVRLIKFFMKFNNSTGQVVGYSQRTLDVIRFGDYATSIDYPGNKPAPSIPEWWSLARYANLVTTDINTFSTDKYFYLTESPIPAWVSQQRSE